MVAGPVIISIRPREKLRVKIDEVVYFYVTIEFFEKVEAKHLLVLVWVWSLYFKQQIFRPLRFSSFCSSCWFIVHD